MGGVRERRNVAGWSEIPGVELYNPVLSSHSERAEVKATRKRDESERGERARKERRNRSLPPFTSSLLCSLLSSAGSTTGRRVLSQLRLRVPYSSSRPLQLLSALFDSLGSHTYRRIKGELRGAEGCSEVETPSREAEIDKERRLRRSELRGQRVVCRACIGS